MHIKSSVLLDIISKHISMLQEMWVNVADDYPGDYQGFTSKAEPLIKCLPFLSGCNVMDIGCNSGMYSLLAAKYANKVTGVDPSDALIKRALLTKNYFNEKLFFGDNVDFINGNFADFINDGDFDSVIASLVLYHLGDENIKVLADFLKSKCKKILIQARPARDKVLLSHPEWGEVCNTKVYGGLYKIESCLDFLRDCGFRDAKVLYLNAMYYDEYFPIIYASK